jgi:hypothetical protein
MIKRLTAVFLLVLLLAPAALAAKEKAEKPVPPPGPMPGMGATCPMPPPPGMPMMEMAGKFWYMGSMAEVLKQLAAEDSEQLAGGALKPEGQKELAGVIKKMGDLIPVIFSPTEVQKPEVVKKQLDDLNAALEKIEAQTKAK